MKLTFISFLLAGTLAFTACNNDGKTTTSENNTASQNDAQTPSAGNPQAPAETSTSAAGNAQAATSLKEVVDHYLHVKNALADDNSKEAASGGQALAAAIDKVDAAAFTAEQKKQYTEIAESLKEHAEHTAHNAGKIDHQREHFVGMSEDVRDLVKNVGADRALYVDHCPMANENKGADWISEVKEIKNPYMGKKMPECGSLKETIEK